MKWTDDGQRAVFIATLPGSIRTRLFSSTADGPPAVELTGPIPTHGAQIGEVIDFDVRGDDVIFWGDLETVDQSSLFSVPADGGPRTHLGVELPPDASVNFARIIMPSTGPPTAVFAAQASFATTLYTIPIAGGALTTLPGGGSFVLSSSLGEPLRFAPNVDRIVYSTLDGRVLSQPLDGSPAVEMGSNGNDVLVQWELTPNHARVLVLELEITGHVTELYSTFITGGPPLKISSDDPRGTGIQRFVITPSSDRLVYTADDRVNGRDELFVSSTVGVGAARLSPVKAEIFSGVSPDFFLTPDGTRVIYGADLLERQVLEAFSVPVDGGASTRISGDLPPGADVISVFPGLDPASAYYVADQNTPDVNELFAADVAGAGTPQVVSGPLMGRLGAVERFEITPDGAHVVYLADQRTFDQPELWGVPSAGGTPVRLSPDLTDGEEIREFKLDPTSRRVVMRIENSLWTSPVDAATPPERLTQNLGFGFEPQFTPDGETVILRGFTAAGRPTLYRVSATGGNAVNLLPADVAYSPEDDLFDISPDGQRIVFSGPDLPAETTARRVYSVPVSGGAPLRLSNLPLSVLLRFSVSADGSYVVFAAHPPGSIGIAIYGSPTGMADTVELVPTTSGLQSSELDQFHIDDDASHLAYIVDGDLFSREIATGITRNLTEGLIGTARSTEFVNGGDDLLLYSGPNQIHSADVFDVNGDGVTPLTSGFVDPQVIEHIVAGDSLLMVLDPDAGNPLVDPIIYSAPLGGSPGVILSGPGQEVIGKLRVNDEFVTYLIDDEITYAAPRDGGPPVLLRPEAADFEDSALSGR
ncbi:MAG: hypothetical protein AAFY88_09495, partial [Acidobacteriota bacterium]